jgi:hypothetical protein
MFDKIIKALYGDVEQYDAEVRCVVFVLLLPAIATRIQQCVLCYFSSRGLLHKGGCKGGKAYHNQCPPQLAGKCQISEGAGCVASNC